MNRAARVVVLLLLAAALSGCPLWDPEDGGFVVENFTDMELTVYPIGDDPGEPVLIPPRDGRLIS